MVSVLLPFLMSMLLGRTIDLRTYQIGGDIYDHEDYTEVQLNVLNSTYTLLDKDVFPYSYIGLPADLVLRIKSGHLHSASGELGLDGLLKTSWKSKSTTVIVSSMLQTVYRELKHDEELLPHWTERIESSQTHYAASLVYGGWSVILYTFVCTHPGDNGLVRRILTEKLGQTGTVNQQTMGFWKEAFDSFKNNPDLQGDVTVKIRRFSSLPLAEDVSTPDQLWEAIHKFESDIGQTGQPLFVELKPLHKLDSRFPSVRESHMLDQEMELVDEMMDDLRYARSSMRRWMSDTLTEFTEEEEEKILKLFNYIGSSIEVFDRVAGNATLYNPMDADVLKSAMRTYHKGLAKDAPSYKMLFLRLKEDLDADCDDSFGEGADGQLKVDHDEMFELGEMTGGLEECKRECAAEPKCRSIGFMDILPVLEYDEDSKDFKMKNKINQCSIYFRSLQTAFIIPMKMEGRVKIYDRNCY